MFWSGAYVSTGSVQSTVRDGILDTVKAFAPLHAKPVEPDKFDGLYQYAALKWNLVVISPQSGQWIAFWGGTPRTHSNVFERNSYSGITLEMEDEKDYQYWSYKLWRDGRIIDWYISDLAGYFGSWKDDSIRRAAEPYLSRYLHKGDFRLEDPENLPPQAFRGQTNMLEETKLVVEGALAKDIATSFRYEQDVAFASFVSHLRLPFKSFDFDPFNIGVYLDVEGKRINLEQHSELKAAYEHASSIQDLDRFSFLLFDMSAGDYPDLFFF